MRRIAIAIVMVSAAVVGGCEARNLDPDAGGSGSLGGLGGAGVGGAGAGGAGGSVCFYCGEPPLLSDFEDPTVATIVRYGSPPRNGYWYTYNDGTCTQTPTPGDPNMPYVGQAPPTGAPIAALGTLSLHAMWSGCTTWGAGIGAELNVPISTDGAIYVGPKRPYDLTAYAAITFWARGELGSARSLKIKLPMRATTSIENGGTCDEEIRGVGMCGDDWGEVFVLPAADSWKQFTIYFSEVAFRQDGWGAEIPWDPKDVTSIRIESVTLGATYDFWLDDIYLIRLR